MTFIVRTAVLAVLFAPVATPVALAQQASAPAAAEGAGLAYRSAFDGYRGFTDQPVGSWRKANDDVGRIGGWKAYAREGQGGGAAGVGATVPIRMPPCPMGVAGSWPLTAPPPCPSRA